jgi:hypothetical protein
MITEIVLVGIVAVLSIVLLIVSHVLNRNSSEDTDAMFVTGVLVLTTTMLAIGALIGETIPRTTTKKLQPTMKIECINTKCDTTWEYDFNKEK